MKKFAAIIKFSRLGKAVNIRVIVRASSMDYAMMELLPRDEVKFQAYHLDNGLGMIIPIDSIVSVQISEERVDEPDIV